MLTPPPRFRRSPLFYVGDKFKLLRQLVAVFPSAINNFYEPFVGGGSVFLNIAAKKYLLNDKNPHLVNIHKFLLESAENSAEFFKTVENLIREHHMSISCRGVGASASLRAKFPKTYYARMNESGYRRLRSAVNSAPDKHPLFLYVLLIYGFNRMLRFNRNGEFNLPVGNVDFNRNVESSLQDYFGYVRGKDIQFFSKDFKEFLAGRRFREGDFVYFDPPYLIAASEYNKMWSEESERELLDLADDLNAKKVKFALSNVVRYNGVRNRMLSAWAKKYNSHHIASNYINYHDNSRKSIKEVIITNY